jgi:predicted protein tyrosine phosphatase
MKLFLAKNSEFSRMAQLAQKHDNIYIISVTNPNDKWAPPLIQDGPDRIALQFDDAEYGNYELFNLEMAEKVVEFIKRVDTNPYTYDLLVVNCMLGVSRSGAISSFARSALNLDYNQWRDDNPQASPNWLVMNLLSCAWGSPSIKAPRT